MKMKLKIMYNVANKTGQDQRLVELLRVAPTKQLGRLYKNVEKIGDKKRIMLKKVAVGGKYVVRVRATCFYRFDDGVEFHSLAKKKALQLQLRILQANPKPLT